jgi:hypothetical protein
MNKDRNFRQLPYHSLFSIAALFILYAACSVAADQPVPKKQFLVPPPPFSPGIFPCSQCHQGMPPNSTPRRLEMHQEINLKHMPGGWCFDCHNPDNRDRLRLTSGRLISFEESYILCGQCHGTILREWKAGLHGKRTGKWNEEKQYLLCVHCHWPHEPAFRQIQPLPPPARPSEIR